MAKKATKQEILDILQESAPGYKEVRKEPLTKVTDPAPDDNVSVDKQQPYRKGDKPEVDDALGAKDNKGKVTFDSIKENIDGEIATLFSESGLDEDFQTKAALLFKTVLEGKVAEKVAVFESEYATKLSEGLASATVELEETVNSFLTYTAEQWVTENTVALESGIRTELAESFMSGLKSLYETHAIEVPESLDVVESLNNQVAELTESLNKALSVNISLTESNKKTTKEILVKESLVGVPVTQVDKVKVLFENVEFLSADDFKTKLSVLKESVVPATKATKATSADSSLLTEDRANDGTVDAPKDEVSSDPFVNILAKKVR